MKNTELHAPSKRIRIVLAGLVTLAVMAAAPASGFAADWSSNPGEVTPQADWSS